MDDISGLNWIAHTVWNFMFFIALVRITTSLYSITSHLKEIRDQLIQMRREQRK